MLISRRLNATLFLIVLHGVVACGGSPAAGGSDGSPAPASSRSTKGGPTPEGSLVVTGDFDQEYAGMERSSSLAPEPYQKTLALRLAFDTGTEPFPSALIDIDDLGPIAESGTYPIGRETDHYGAFAFLSSDPAASSPRFTLLSGSLQLEVSGATVSGSLTAEAREKTFGPREEERTIRLEARFDDVRLVPRDSD